MYTWPTMPRASLTNTFQLVVASLVTFTRVTSGQMQFIFTRRPKKKAKRAVPPPSCTQRDRSTSCKLLAKSNNRIRCSISVRENSISLCFNCALWLQKKRKVASLPNIVEFHFQLFIYRNETFNDRLDKVWICYSSPASNVVLHYSGIYPL